MSNNTPGPVAEEQRLLEVVLATARKHRLDRVDDNYERRLLELRDEIAEERLAEDQASLLEQMERLAALAAQRSRYSETDLDAGTPYFGHMRLIDDKDGSRRDILIGKQTWVKEGVRIVDWRNAPISQVFYQRLEGEDFEIPIAGRMMEGEVALRRTVTIREGELRRVASPRGIWVQEPMGWRDITDMAPILRGGAGASVKPGEVRPVLGRGGSQTGRPERIDKHLPEIASLLDPEQFDLITRPDATVVAIQGSAGSGKTTVALHRVAYLAFQNPRRFDGSRCLVIVFSLALQRYISQVLPALGVQSVSVRTYDDWAREVRRRLFDKKVPDKYAEDTPASVSRFKLHSALIHMLLDGWMMNQHLGARALWDELFTNRGWLETINDHEPGAFSTNQLNAIHRWCSDMHFVRFEGKGHRDYEEPCIDREDDTILLYLYQMMEGALRGKKGTPLRYGQLVVDEAQDLSPLELKVLHGCVEPKGAITLAGDTAQRLDADNDFVDWAHVLGQLGLDHVALSPLKISYRSTVEIMNLARAVLGPLAPDEPVVAPRRGVPPELLRFRSRGEMFTFLSDALRDLTDAEPTASVAVLARHVWQADMAYQALERGDFVSLERIAEHDFSFAPGVEVTDIRQSKGLEFDYVVVIDTDVDTFPATDAARHLLHVAVTRAAHQVWMMCVGTPTALIPADVPTTEI